MAPCYLTARHSVKATRCDRVPRASACLRQWGTSRGGLTFDTADAATYNLPWFQHAIAMRAACTGCSPAIHAVVWTAFLLLRWSSSWCDPAEKDNVMPQTFHRDRFTWMAYLFLAFYGYFLNVLGPITPFLKNELHLSYTVSSLHFTAFAVGILVVGLGGHVLIRRLGRWRALWIGAAGMSVSALVLVVGRTPVITIGAAFLMGVVGSLILAIIPSGFPIGTASCARWPYRKRM